jgi:hypothetical protein
VRFFLIVLVSSRAHRLAVSIAGVAITAARWYCARRHQLQEGVRADWDLNHLLNATRWPEPGGTQVYVTS